MSEYEVAFKQVPKKIYENLLFGFGVPYLPLLLMFLMNQEQNRQFLMPSGPHLSLTLLSALAMIIGRIADANSTVKTEKINIFAESKGIHTGLKELSPVSGPHPTIEKFKKIASFEAIFTGLTSACFPILGTMIGLQGGFNSLNNSRKSRRIEKAIQLKN